MRTSLSSQPERNPEYLLSLYPYFKEEASTSFPLLFCPHLKQKREAPAGPSLDLSVIHISAISHQCFHAKAVIKNALAQAQVLGCHFKQLIIGKKLQALFQAQNARRNQPERFV